MHTQLRQEATWAAGPSLLSPVLVRPIIVSIYSFALSFAPALAFASLLALAFAWAPLSLSLAQARIGILTPLFAIMLIVIHRPASPEHLNPQGLQQ